MKVEYLFSRNNKMGSRMISWAAKYEKLGIDELPSHVAVLLNDRIVVESTFTSGVRMIPYKKWLQRNKQVDRIPCVNLHRASKDVFEELTRLWGRKYDWSGILYFSFMYFRLILFKKPLPSCNKWQDKNKYFCTEFVEVLSKAGCSMCSPAKLLKEWKNER